MDFQLLGDIVWASILTLTTLNIAAWVYSLIKKRPQVFDMAWAAGFIIVAILTFALAEGIFLRRLIIFLLTTIWAIRLLAFFVRRFIAKAEDGRFQHAREWAHAT